MILKSIRLQNIRSYLNETINFPEGSVLLCGDIGSGKSTVLLAVEFALFGILRGDLSGATLLRHGKNNGSVELRLDVDGKDIYIKRSLKRQAANVQQDAGFIMVDGMKKQGTPVELKTTVLDLLGYPKELLTKSKSLIYRYTVYTPQEEMKQILTEESEKRKDTLRRIFGIDRYKRVAENTDVFIKKIKEKRSEFSGMISDLEEKKEQLKTKEQDKGFIEQQIEKFRPHLERIKSSVEEKNRKLKLLKEKTEKLNELKKELALNDINLKNKIEQRENNNEEIKLLEEQISKLKKELPEKEVTEIETVIKRIKEEQEKIDNEEKAIKELNNKISELKTKRQSCEEIKEKVAGVDKCPTCLQDVTAEHKNNVIRTENKKIEVFEEETQKNLIVLKQAENKLSTLKQGLEELNKKEKELAVSKERMKNLDEKIKRGQSLTEIQERMKQVIAKINTEKIKIGEEIKKFIDVEKFYNNLTEEVEELKEREKELQLKRASFVTKREGLQEIIDNLNSEINKKLEIKDQIKRLVSMQHWLDSFFIKLTSKIEKQVMLKVHKEFNELFTEWFNTLMGEEILNVRLDEEFTPVIEQNGYETGFSNLSGGEKTSVALAYRLALNKVINDMIGNIKTKDIIILDEPTDGFSTEQLDKIRDVLGQLDIKQTVIVSHESKIESFVDNIVRINKEEHVSRVL